MGALLKNSQKSSEDTEQLRKDYLRFCHNLVVEFYSLFNKMNQQSGYEPSLEIDEGEWVRVMQDLFSGVCSNFGYYQEKIKEIDHIAARLFFTKIKQHTGGKGLRDGNKRSAIIAVIIHYAIYRWAVEQRDRDEIDLGITSEDMYSKAKDIAEKDSMNTDDEDTIYQLEQWFTTGGSSLSTTKFSEAIRFMEGMFYTRRKK